MGRSKYNSFQWLKEKVWQRVSNWRNKLLSQASREILIKAVLQVLPVFTMSIFYLPRGLCCELNSLMAWFWWRANDQSRKVHWISWKTMGRPKTNGGMGFWDLESFNLLLLAKQLWWILSRPHSLVVIILKEKYFPTNEAQIRGGASFCGVVLPRQKIWLRSGQEEGGKWGAHSRLEGSMATNPFHFPCSITSCYPIGKFSRQRFVFKRWIQL